METSEEIIKNISNKLEEMKRKGIKVTRIPLWAEFANHIVYGNRFGSSHIKDDVCTLIDKTLKRKNMIYHISKGTIIYRARKIKRNEIKKNAEGIFEGFDEKKSGIPPYSNVIKLKKAK